jgi:Arm DNA-binding domain
VSGRLTARGVESLAKRKGRWLDQHGLFLRVLAPGRRVYWVYRFTTDGKEREKSVGAYPEMSLAAARIKHAELRIMVLKGVDPIVKADPTKKFQHATECQTNPPRLMLTRGEAPGLTHLYRHYDFDGKLLYVGVSHNTIDRWTSHKRKASWVDLIATIRIDHYPTREAAEDAEADAILAERPRFNSQVRINQQELRVLRRNRRKVSPKPETVAEPAP